MSDATLLENIHYARMLGLDPNTGRAFSSNRRWQSQTRLDEILEKRTNEVMLEQRRETEFIKWRFEHFTDETPSGGAAVSQWYGLTLWHRFYIVCQSGSKIGVLAGGYVDFESAKAHLDLVRMKAFEIDRFAVFYTFAIVTLPTDKPGILNHLLGF